MKYHVISLVYFLKNESVSICNTLNPAKPHCLITVFARRSTIYLIKNTTMGHIVNPRFHRYFSNGLLVLATSTDIVRHLPPRITLNLNSASAKSYMDRTSSGSRLTPLHIYLNIDGSQILGNYEFGKGIIKALQERPAELY